MLLLQGGFTELTTLWNQSKTGPKEAIQPLEEDRRQVNSFSGKVKSFYSLLSTRGC